MSKLKAYFVEMKISAVVMAESEMAAMGEAESRHREICMDSDLAADYVSEVQSLEHMARLDPDWSGDCVPYGGDGNTRLRDLLPEKTPFKDTKTINMFIDTESKEAA